MLALRALYSDGNKNGKKKFTYQLAASIVHNALRLLQTVHGYNFLG